MDGASCSLNFKHKHSNLSVVLAFMFTLLALARVDDASLCKQGWVEANNMCYQLKQTTQNWNASQTLCQADGANLVSIGSEEEYLFVLSLLQNAHINDIWIGLKYIDSEGEYQWVDQSPLVFTNMSSSDPIDNYKECVQIKTSHKRWTPQYCALSWPAVCKYVPSVVNEDFSIQENYTRQQLYTSLPNKLLLNHVFSKRSAPSLLHCTLFCLRDAKCVSLNYRSSKIAQNSQTRKGICLLNSASAEEFPEDFVDNSVYIYALPIK